MEIINVTTLKIQLRQFAQDRLWQDFHNPKNLAMALIVEAGELVEIFQWLTPLEAKDMTASAEKKQAVADELADVLLYAVQLADVLKIDLAAAITDKIQLNASKYPIPIR